MIPQLSKPKSQTKFIVHLVGAGPGDPGLITLRGASLLASADAVVYDALVNPRLLSHCPKAEKIYVGKRAAQHSMSQEKINDLLIELARAGKQVVRLKGGDPFVFGRGGEECEALAGAGIGFEVVPGITAAIAVPAYAGIPVTHRDFNSSFTFLTGHEKEEDFQDAAAKDRTAGSGSDIDWPSIAKLPCIAFYMGVKSLPRICAKLIEHGLPADTPAATISSGTLANQRTVVATVGELPACIAQAKLQAPAITIIGKVVSLRENLNWFETRPLFGKTIVVTRAREQASELTAQLESLGARVIETPAIELIRGDQQIFTDAITREYDWIIFTSANGAKFTRQCLVEAGLDVRVFGKARIGVVGSETAEAVGRYLSLKIDCCPPEALSDSLVRELLKTYEVKAKKFLLLRADIARPLLAKKLIDAGASVVDVPIYQTKASDKLTSDILTAFSEKQVDWITFTSSSTVDHFFAALGNISIEFAKLASIGPVTSGTILHRGLRVDVQAAEQTIAGLVQAILKHP